MLARRRLVLIYYLLPRRIENMPLNVRHAHLQVVHLKYNSACELSFIQCCESKNIKITNGPTLKYVLEDKQHFYYVDFEILDKYIVEIKGSNHHYYQALSSGEIDAKNKSAQLYAEQNNKIFLYLLDYDDYNDILEKCLSEI